MVGRRISFQDGLVFRFHVSFRDFKAMPNTMGGFKKIDGFLRNEKPRFGKHKQDIRRRKFLPSAMPGVQVAQDQHKKKVGLE